MSLCFVDYKNLSLFKGYHFSLNDNIVLWIIKISLYSKVLTYIFSGGGWIEKIPSYLAFF